MLSENLTRLRRERRFTLEQLAERVGTSRQTVHRYETGAISNVPPEKVELLARALGVSAAALMGWEEELAVRRLPILGEIACGEPIFATEERESFAVAGAGVNADFCLRAHGDSMTGARIFDGDIVFIKSQDTVENGQIAAVIIGEEATLKRVYFYPEEGKLILSPENPKYAPLVYMGGELESIKILGRAVAFQSSVI